MLVTLADYLTPDDWARACAVAAMLEAQEAARLARKRAFEAAWRERPRPPPLPQQRFDWNA